MEVRDAAGEFVDEEWPLAHRHLIPSALRRAYAATDEMIEREPRLQTPGGRYQRGDLINLATSYELEKLVKTGKLPFDGEWSFFAKPTGKYYVIITPRSRITTSQVENPQKRPRRAVHRTNYAELNEQSLFDSINDEITQKLEEAKRDQERRLLHILHGYQVLQFAHITYPHPEKNRHIYRTGNLLGLPHEVSSDLSPQEGPATSPDPEVVESIERRLRDDE